MALVITGTDLLVDGRVPAGIQQRPGLRAVLIS